MTGRCDRPLAPVARCRRARCTPSPGCCLGRRSGDRRRPARGAGARGARRSFGCPPRCCSARRRRRRGGGRRGRRARRRPPRTRSTTSPRSRSSRPHAARRWRSMARGARARPAARRPERSAHGAAGHRCARRTRPATRSCSPIPAARRRPRRSRARRRLRRRRRRRARPAARHRGARRADRAPGGPDARGQDAQRVARPLRRCSPASARRRSRSSTPTSPSSTAARATEGLRAVAHRELPAGGRRATGSPPGAGLAGKVLQSGAADAHQRLPAHRGLLAGRRSRASGPALAVPFDAGERAPRRPLRRLRPPAPRRRRTTCALLETFAELAAAACRNASAHAGLAHRRPHRRADRLPQPRRAARGPAPRDRARRARRPAALSLVLLDLDDFKQVNEEHGHLVGDEVLRRVGPRCAAAPARTTSRRATAATSSRSWPPRPTRSRRSRSPSARSSASAPRPPSSATTSAGGAPRASPSGRPALTAAQLIARADRALLHGKQQGGRGVPHAFSAAARGGVPARPLRASGRARRCPPRRRCRPARRALAGTPRRAARAPAQAHAPARARQRARRAAVGDDRRGARSSRPPSTSSTAPSATSAAPPCGSAPTATSSRAAGRGDAFLRARDAALVASRARRG